MGVLKDINTPNAKEVSNMAKGKEDEKEEKKELGPADRVIEARVKAEEAKVALDTLGSPGGGESIQTTIVKESLAQNRAVMEELYKQIAQANKELLEARRDRESALTELYKERIAILHNEQTKLDEKAQSAEGIANKSIMDVYRDVRGEIQTEIDALKKEAPQAVAHQPVTSDETQIRLAELQLQNTREIYRIQQESENTRREWELKMKQFEEESRRRWAEYGDKREMQREGLQGFQDIAHSISAGLGRDRTGEAVAGEATVEASISSFPCQICHTPIHVEPGQTEANCENPECGAAYELQRKG